MALHTNVWGNRSNRGNRVTVGEEVSREVWCAESGCSKIWVAGLQNGVLAPSGGYSGYLGYRTGSFALFFVLFSGMFVRSDIFPYLAPQKFDSM